MKITKENRKNGFTIFVAMLTITVVLTIGIGIINLTLKEFSFAVIGRESLEAFYAADSALECAFHHDLAGVGSGTIKFSAFPSHSTATTSNGTLIPQNIWLQPESLIRKGGSPLGFPASVSCNEQDISLQSRYIITGTNNATHTIETMIDGNSAQGDMFLHLTDQTGENVACASFSVKKIVEYDEDDNVIGEQSEINARGMNLSDCTTSNSRRVERALRLVWGTRAQ